MSTGSCGLEIDRGSKLLDLLAVLLEDDGWDVAAITKEITTAMSMKSPISSSITVILRYLLISELECDQLLEYGNQVRHVKGGTCVDCCLNLRRSYRIARAHIYSYICTWSDTLNWASVDVVFESTSSVVEVVQLHGHSSAV